jgi:hypothetical protein
MSKIAAAVLEAHEYCVICLVVAASQTVVGLQVRAIAANNKRCLLLPGEP